MRKTLAPFAVYGALIIAAVMPASAATPGTQPRDMKLLLLGVDGTEPAFQAAKTFLDYLGTPYDAIVTKTQPLPALSDGSKGFYQGIVLSSGNLAYCGPTGCASALSDAGWSAIDAYMRDYRVRLAAFYAWPEARYGLTATGSLGTDTTPANAVFTTGAAGVFPYLNRANPLKISGAWMFLAAPSPAAGETTTSLMTVNGATVTALHTKADGREYMALTFDQNPNLLHSLALNYGVFNWVTKGVFLGSRRIYLSPQNDDVFLPNELFVSGVSACMPSLTPRDATYASGVACPERRMSDVDLDTIRQWQDNLNAQSQFARFRVTMVFNGFGSAYGDPDVPANDPLTAKVMQLKSKFYWINHTYDHENLDCFLPTPNSGVCTPASYSQSFGEINDNLTVAAKLGLPLDRTSMVTPAITGLTNANFLAAAKALGIKYLVGDTSRVGGLPTVPNTGIRSAIEPSILMVPRRPMNVYYNTFSGTAKTAGSLPDEYNYFFGPGGIFRLADGSPFFSSPQTYAQIVDRESDTLVGYMLRYEMYPTMWHQSNFIRYTNSKTLFTDVMGSALTKFSKMSNLPVISLQNTDLGKELEDRMGYLAANVKATLTPGAGISVSATSAAKIPVTGVCKGTCETYGGQSLSKVPVSAGTTYIPLN